MMKKLIHNFLNELNKDEKALFLFIISIVALIIIVSVAELLS